MPHIIDRTSAIAEAILVAIVILIASLTAVQPVQASAPARAPAAPVQQQLIPLPERVPPPIYIYGCAPNGRIEIGQLDPVTITEHEALERGIQCADADGIDPPPGQLIVIK